MTVALGKLPIDTSGGYWSILHSIRDQKPPTLPDNGSFSSEFRDFLSLMLRHDPLERPSCADLLKHPFLSKGYVEDISEGYSVEDGMQEFKKIFIALYSHLEKLKKELESPDTFSKKIHGDSFISRALRNKSGAQLIQEAVFGELKAVASSEQSNNRSSPADRLRTLAKQLRIPIDLALNIAVSLCQDLSSTRNSPITTTVPTKECFAATPKASHSSV